MKIACWSGPRNLSTAMMYSFASRPDFAVWDEPFYAAYLLHTGIPHPMRDEIIASHEPDPNLVGAMCKGTIPEGKANFYMKHMALHMLPEFPMDWAESCTNIHLLRHPARVVASYGAKRTGVTQDDIGFRQQVEVYKKVGGVVVDSADIRKSPRATLARLCNAIGLEFDPAMLSWSEGGHPSDGIWASHWYGAIHKSTGFAGAEGPLPELEGDAAALMEEALPYYRTLEAHKI
ncbi:HAD family hydrolase [Pelagovum pacificum]|uniref:HAD family hydrolase n=1 Tax=Pelagovum pacificum TaxID=2588711 RepID=A0A5C5GHE5_9RHOB|nr:HAD family hydrolase [Pelagovum pacificum]QQA42831.1 HAD family hydrolase [Pelagovum pacificum]TNY34020.1 HAD family hydrolase [Pelagovum pacificum]